MNQEKVGKFIKEIRTKNNLTQKEFADKLGVTFQAVSKWENGKNIPDIVILKEISKMFNVNIDEILDGEVKEKDNNDNKRMFLITAGGVIIIVIVVIATAILVQSNGHDFEFKQISTSCDNFNITGSMAYNKDKTSLYISSVEFCGSDDNEVYESISCTLYESYDGNEKKISSCGSDRNITLEEYLKEVEISVDNYKVSCSDLTSSSLYLEINATLSGNKNITYNIPITLSDNCSR